MRIRDKKHLHNLCLGLIHSLVILIPFGMALFTGAYAIFNKNAKDSYTSSEVLKETPVLNETLVQDGFDYIFNISNFIDVTTANGNTGYSIFYYPKDKIDWSVYKSSITNEIIEETVQFRFERANANNLNLYLYNSDNTNIQTISYNLTYWRNNLLTNYNLISFNMINHRIPTSKIYGNFLFQITYVRLSLDNAFEYGFEKTNDSFEHVNYSILDFDALELFDIDYSNNVYLTFVNHYIKYLLNMELVLFIPEILLIFFTLVRRLMLSIVDKTDERSY